MRATTMSDVPTSERVTLTSKELQALLGCGKDAAKEIGTKANAKIKVGRRVFWNVQKVQEYLNKVSC